MELTLWEAQELHATVIQMLARLRRDKHVHPDTIKLWEALQDKLIKEVLRHG